MLSSKRAGEACEVELRGIFTNFPSCLGLNAAVAISIAVPQKVFHGGLRAHPKARKSVQGHRPGRRMVLFNPYFSLWGSVPYTRVVSGILPWTVCWEGPERETVSSTQTHTSPAAHRSTRNCSHWRSHATFPKNGYNCSHFYWNWSMSWHQNTLFLAEMSSVENEQLALKDFHFCYTPKPRLSSYRGKTSMTFQTLPKKNTSDSRAWGWRRGVRRKGKWKQSHNKENIMLLEMKLHDAGTPPENPRDWLSTRW